MTDTPVGDSWVDGSYESGGDSPRRGRDDVPNPETGAGIGQGEPNSFEPEEEPDADVPDA